MIYTAWGEEDSYSPHTLTTGSELPYPWSYDSIPVCFYQIEADSWDEANREYHRLQGWGPYKPFTEENTTMGRCDWDFKKLVAIELAECRKKQKPINSHHEGFAVLAEEVDEYWDEVKKKPSKRDCANMLTELTQIAVVCQRIAEDLGLLNQE